MRWSTVRRRWARRVAVDSFPTLFRPSDRQAMLVSYPRSGNTWVRFLLAGLLGDPDAVNYRNLNDAVPDLYGVSPGDLRREPIPPVVKSHEPFHPGYGRVVYLVRDPRDVLLSYFHHMIKWEDHPDDLLTFGRSFLDGGLDTYGTWRQHVGSWVGAREGDADFLVVHYEALLTDPAAGLSRMADFLDIRASHASVVRAVEAGDAERLRKLERDPETATEGMLQAGGGASIIRRAGASHWRDELPESLSAELGERWGSWLLRLGYDPEPAL